MFSAQFQVCNMLSLCMVTTQYVRIPELTHPALLEFAVPFHQHIFPPLIPGNPHSTLGFYDLDFFRL